VHCTNISPDFECQGQRSRSPGTNKRKSAAFFLESSSGARSYSAAFLSGAVLGGAAIPVGKSAHAV